MANYKIKDLQQAQTLNGAVALEIQDGDSMSTFATLDQIAEFLGNTTPVVLLTKAGPIDDSYLPDMSASEIAAAYDRIVADPIHTVPVVRIPDNGGQYLVPSGYGVHADTKAVIGYYASQTYVLPSSLTLTSETFTLSRLPYTASSMEWADLLNNTALPSGYLGIDSDSTSEEISAAVGGVDAFRKLCSKLLRRNCIVVVSTDPAAANRNASIPVIVDVNRSVGLPLKITLEIEYISSGKYIALTITESGGTFSAMRTSVSVSDIPDALAGKADLDSATGYIKSSQIAPLQGRQTGVNTSDGYFSSDAPALLFEGDRTHEICFTTGDDVTTDQRLFTTARGSQSNVQLFVSNGSMYAYIGSQLMNAGRVSPETSYHVLLSVDVANTTGKVYVNGVLTIRHLFFPIIKMRMCISSAGLPRLTFSKELSVFIASSITPLRPRRSPRCGTAASPNGICCLCRVRCALDLSPNTSPPVCWQTSGATRRARASICRMFRPQRAARQNCRIKVSRIKAK